MHSDVRTKKDIVSAIPTQKSSGAVLANVINKFFLELLPNKGGRD